MTRQDAIDAKCKDCNWDDKDIGTWREQVESCASTDCSLWEYRPLTSATVKANLEARVSAMTPEQLVKFKAKQDSARAKLAIRQESKTSSDL